MISYQSHILGSKKTEAVAPALKNIPLKPYCLTYTMEFARSVLTVFGLLCFFDQSKFVVTFCADMCAPKSAISHKIRCAHIAVWHPNSIV